MSSLFKEITSLSTERNNPATSNIDVASIREIIELIVEEDLTIVPAVRAELNHIEFGVRRITDAFRHGGRLFYVGAGTSGRLGVVDASECPPTFGVDPEMIQGIIAGGRDAMFRAQEGAEDSVVKGAEVLDEYSITTNDVVCGIAASGRTPFVRGAIDEARRRGIFTILVTTNSRQNLSSMKVVADCIIAPQVGAEVIAGSTRMKSGTAQKLVLNMLTTASMIHLGKTYGNIMVDLQLTNAKLVERAKNIIMTICEVDYHTASNSLIDADGHVKTALVMLLAGVDCAEAKKRLETANGIVRVAIKY
jgi:N-acetylmuramic acid 6-phosphate etherase